MHWFKGCRLTKIITLIITSLFLYTISQAYRIRDSNDIKYILLWKEYNTDPLSGFLNGQNAFIKFECAVKNCYVTNDKKFFGGNLRKFDAIMFNEQQLDKDKSMYPQERYKHQKYVLVSLESASNYPICYSFLDGFFNWTATYKLNSDVVFKYYVVIDKENGAVVGPSINMRWVEDEDMKEIDVEFANTLKTKTKAAAWFVSNCPKPARNKFVKDLQEALTKYGLSIDVYGKCGPFKCPLTDYSKCAAMVKKDYYFYMALENSFNEDYVTEKVLHGLLNNAVPIVFGGANYSRFLPPGSYLNGRQHTAIELAAIMNNVIKSSYLYHQYFKWRNHYEFVSSMPEDRSGILRMFKSTKYEGFHICNFCAALHDNDKEKNEKSTVYENIRSWWLPNYTKHCRG